MGRGISLNDDEKSQIIKLLADKVDVEEICTILNRNRNTIRRFIKNPNKPESVLKNSTFVT
ncbi:hypothetical protein A3Q56_08707 [Intoshia linei]|uniref:Tc3 transposase DNA binding domain-containing protein n=1 Tax=Intoshia linei TaxID=1819745 RepID=A0A177ANH3_9BILA|nr:hypothetical protein A3Q56_08707 [Intoshia linei]